MAVGMHRARQLLSPLCCSSRHPAPDRIPAPAGAIAPVDRNGREDAVRLEEPDRWLEASLVGTWEQYRAGEALGMIVLFPDHTYRERAAPRSAFATMLYREFGGQEWGGPWRASTGGPGAARPTLHLHLDDVAFLGRSLLAPIIRPLIRLCDRLMPGPTHLDIAAIAPEKIVFQHGDIWLRRRQSDRPDASGSGSGERSNSGYRQDRVRESTLTIHMR